jgi:hypothetical protein
MNLYLFIYPQDQELSDHELWNEGKYAAAVWESCDVDALKFAQDFYKGYNQSWVIRQVQDPSKLSANYESSRYSNEWDTDYDRVYDF